MNAVINKPGTKSKPKAAKPITPETPELVFSIVLAGLHSASKLLGEARDIGDDGDLGERAMRVAHERLDGAIERIAPTDHAMFLAYDALFDVEGILCGVAAMHKGDGRGVLCQSAIDQLEAVFPDFDRLSFWPKESEASETATTTLAAEPAGTSWDDDEMHEVNATIAEAIAVMRSRGEDANSSLLYGAIYAAEHAKAVLGLGLDNQSAQDCEDASAPIGVALAVLDAALLDFDDIALHGAWRLLDLAHSRLDAAVFKAAA